MPRRKTLRRKPRISRMRRRRYRKKATSTSYALMKDPFPKLMRTRLRYVENIQKNPAGLSSLNLYNLNSIYDPNRTGTGGQPAYVPILLGAATGNYPYHRYRVRGCAYKITVSNTNTPIRFGIFPSNDLTTVTTFDEFAENPLAKNTIVNSMANGSSCVKTFKGYIKIAKLLGEKVDSERDQAVYNANPTNVAILSLYAQSLDGATNITSLNINVELVYYVDLFDRPTIDV